jgi:hypothetical protein
MAIKIQVVFTACTATGIRWPTRSLETIADLLDAWGRWYHRVAREHVMHGADQDSRDEHE